MAAGKTANFSVEIARAEFLSDFPAELGEERTVIGGVDHEHLLGPALELVKEVHGADAGKGMAQLRGVEYGLNSGANVAGGVAGPDYISKVGGGVVEDVDAYARIVSAGVEGVAGAQACTEDSELGIALLLEPIDAATDIDDSLSRGVDGASDVGADGVVGAMEFGGHADVVIRHAEAQGRDSEVAEDFREGVVTDGVAIPLRNDYDGALGLAFGGRRRKPTSVYHVIFWIGRTDWRGEAEERTAFSRVGEIVNRRVGVAAGSVDTHGALFQPEVRRDLVTEKLFAVGYHVVVQFEEVPLLLFWSCGRGERCDG